MASRLWLVPFWNDASATNILVGAVLGLLLAILFFVEHNITGVLLTKPSNQLYKGTSFHWDLAVVAISSE